MLVGDTPLEPDVGTVPIPGVIVALVDDHLNVALWPRSMEAGEADRLTAGAGAPLSGSPPPVTSIGLTGSVVNAWPTSNSKTITAIWPARARMEIDLAFEIGGIRLGEELLNKRGYPASGLNGPAGLASRHHQAILILELGV